MSHYNRHRNTTNRAPQNHFFSTSVSTLPSPWSQKRENLKLRKNNNQKTEEKQKAKVIKNLLKRPKKGQKTIQISQTHTKMNRLTIVAIVIISSGHIGILGQNISPQLSGDIRNKLTLPVTAENSQSSDETTSVIAKNNNEEESPARQGPQQPGWGVLISGKNGNL